DGISRQQPARQPRGVYRRLARHRSTLQAGRHPAMELQYPAATAGQHRVYDRVCWYAWHELDGEEFQLQLRASESRQQPSRIASISAVQQYPDDRQPWMAEV